MSKRPEPILSVVVPLYNEAASLPEFYSALKNVLDGLGLAYEIIFVNDGSTDPSAEIVQAYKKDDGAVRLISFSRNFGKEMATTAGIHKAGGQATLILDADGQHPVDRIPEFVARWRGGAKVVIGRRVGGRQTAFTKRLGYKLFYGVFRRLTGLRLHPDLSDFRLIDRAVQVQFNQLTEHNRVTRGLIDWLGYERAYVPYTENLRRHGTATYSYSKLFKHALDWAISLSISPLYITAYIGAVVLPVATLLGLGMLTNFALGDPLNLHATGGAYLLVVALFLIGLLMVSQGIIGLYLSHIHTETQQRPLYVIDQTNPEG
ncbi:MAG TPA: glycosyltransferase family 2 protein [Candidatus Saccharimonadales bacterium]|nr:glycosyltransferase family 2 protein [Candidatus Saccharimonadales bacterium]